MTCCKERLGRHPAIRLPNDFGPTEMRQTDGDPSYNELNIRNSHPNLYRGILTVSLISIALALNFFFTNPTFNPYGIHKTVVGGIFLGLGSAKLLFLIVYRNLQYLRLVMTAQIMFMLFWGGGSVITYIQGKTSVQLMVLYGGLAMLEVFLLIEPVVNPMTKKSPESDTD